MFFVLNFVWPALWLCHWLWHISYPVLYRYIYKPTVLKCKGCCCRCFKNGEATPVSFNSGAGQPPPSPSSTAVVALAFSRLSNFWSKFSTSNAFPLHQFVKFVLKPGQINLVDSLVTVAHLNTFLFVVSFGFSLICILFGSNRAYRFLLSLLLRLMVSKYNFQNKHFK